MPARHHRSLLFCVLAFAGLVRSLNVTVDDSDARVQYFPENVLPEAACKNNPTNAACLGHWWVEHDAGDSNNTIHDTLGPDTACIFIFQGSALTMFGVTLNFGAVGVVTLDSGPPQNVSFVSSDNLLHAGVQLYHIDGLDPSQPHVFKLTFQDASFGSTTVHHWLAIDYFVYEMPDDAAGSTNGASFAPASTAIPTLTTTEAPASTSAPTSAATSAAISPGLSTASIAIIAGSVAGAVVLLAGGAFILWRTYHPRERPPAPSRPPIEPASPPLRAVRSALTYPFTGRGSQSGSSNSAGRSAGRPAPRSVTYPSSHSAAEPPQPPRPPPVPARRATRVFRVQNPDVPPSAASEG